MSTLGSPGVPARRGYNGPLVYEVCGCVVEAWHDADGPQARIHRCDLHNAAEEMRALLHEAWQNLDSHAGERTELAAWGVKVRVLLARTNGGSS